MKRIVACMALILLAFGPVFAQRADLSGLKFCIDPGHGGSNPANDRYLVPDPGTEFWESESNFQKALLLKSMLEAQGATVILTRYTNDYPDDNLEPSLAARVALANANNVNWFHSIHSNATGLAVNNSINYTLMLVREKRPGGPASSSGNGLGVPETQEAWDISLGYMSPNIQKFLRTFLPTRTYLDWTFYGGTSGGFSLGVLRGLLMPGQLSEGSMHDFFPETRRLMNNDYRKMEAYALRNSFMQYFGVPTDDVTLVCGLQSEVGTNRFLNNTKVRLMPGKASYTGDGYNNGFFMLEGPFDGPYTISFVTPGYTTEYVRLNLTRGSVVFVDKVLESLMPPRVLNSTPARGDTLFSAATSITIQFSKPMNVATVQSAFSITPPFTGKLSWTNTNTTMVFDPDSILSFFTYFTVRIDTSARSAGGQMLDGNGDGVPGDPFVLTFKTREVDAVPPRIVAAYPAGNVVLPSPTLVLNVTFDEPLNPATVNTSNVALQKIVGTGGTTLPRIVKYWEAGRKGGVNIFLASPLEGGSSYRIRISGIADVVGNAVPAASPYLWEFSVAPVACTYTTLDSFDTTIANWGQPGTSGSTVGIDSASFVPDTTKMVSLTGDMGSAQLRYTWRQSSSEWLIREPLNSGAGHAARWRKENTALQVYVNGDGSGNRFRLCVADSVNVFPGGTPSNYEVSKWFTIDWVGWKLVEWDLEHDSVGTWIGNGMLEGELRFDSFQLTYVPGSGSISGRLLFNQLQLATKVPLGVVEEEGELPLTFALYQNYPNPFNPTTTIKYDIPPGVTDAVSFVVYDILGREVSRYVENAARPGHYAVPFDARQLASGLYFYELRSGTVRLVKKMVLMK